MRNEIKEISQEAIDLTRDIRREICLGFIGEIKGISNRSIKIYNSLDIYDQDFICYELVGIRKKNKMKAYMSELCSINKEEEK